MSGRRLSVVVGGWRFSTEAGGVYVDAGPVWSRVAVDAVHVGGLVETRAQLEEVGRDWLAQYAPDLTEYERAARFYG